MASANRIDLGQPIEGDTRLLSGQADAQPEREAVTHLIPGENKEDDQVHYVEEMSGPSLSDADAVM